MMTSVVRPEVSKQLQPVNPKFSAHRNEDNRLFVLTDDDSDVAGIKHHLDSQGISDIDQKIIHIHNSKDYEALSRALTDRQINKVGLIVRNDTRTTETISSKLDSLFEYLKKNNSNNNQFYIAADGSFNNPTSIATPENHKAFDIANLGSQIFTFLCKLFKENFQFWLNAQVPNREPQVMPSGKGEIYKTTIMSSTETPKRPINTLDPSKLAHIIHQPGKRENVHNTNIHPDIKTFLPFVDKIFGLGS